MNAHAVQLPERSPSLVDVGEFIDAFQARYNTGEADAVADLYSVDARWLTAAGAVLDGRPRIRQGLAQLMETVSPRLTLTEQDRFVFGDRAVSRGCYAFTSGDGSRTTWSGAYLNQLRYADSGWQIVSQQMNYASPICPEMWVGDLQAMRALPLGEMASGVAAICEQLLGSRPPFGDLLTADVCAALPGRPWEIGCEAIADQLLSANRRRTRVRFHELAASPLSEQQSAHSGWYEVIGDEALHGATSRWGTATLVARRQLDGTRRIRWLVATASPEA